MLPRSATALFGMALTACLLAGHARAESAGVSPPALTSISPSNAGFSEEGLRALEAYAKERIKSGVVPGVVFYLARHGKAVAVRSYGDLSFGGEKMTVDTIFRAYSMTKPVTALAMMILYEEGKWTLDDPITKFLPELANIKVFRTLTPDGKPILEDLKRPATMRELMTHTAGFAYGLAPTDYVNKAYQDAKLFESRDLADFVERLAQLPLADQPGVRWRYSFSSDLQGYIVEKLSGQTLDVFFKARIFDPLGMKDTSFVVPPGGRSRFAALYGVDPETGKLADISQAPADYSKPPTLRSGGGGLVTTATDYARFCQTLLNGGELDGVRIAAADSIRLMGTNLLPDGVWLRDRSGEPQKGLGYGMSIGVLTDPVAQDSPQGAGTMTWGGAASTFFWVDPKNDLLFVWMEQRFGDPNQFGNEPRRLVYEALEHPER